MKSKIFLLILLLGATISCNDLLNFSPETEMSESVFWKTPEHFKMASGSLYNHLDHPKYQTDYKADILIEGSQSVVNDEQKGNIQVWESDATWNSNYSYIRECNIILEKAAAYPDPASIEQYIAEARFFRAYFYYKLYIAFGGVPVIQDVLDIDSENLYRPRDSRKYTFDFILKELNDVIPMLPLLRDINDNDYGRVSKQAAMALRARFCLREATWRKYHNEGNYSELLIRAVNDSYSIIETGDYQIFNHPTELGKESYKYLFILEDEECNPGKLRKKDNKEYILTHRYNGSISPMGAANRSFAPTRKFMDLFVCTNGLPVTYNGQTNPQFKGYNSKWSEFENRDFRMTSLVRQEDKVYYSFGSYARWGNPNPPTEPYTNNFGSGSATGYYCDKFSSERFVDNGGEGFDYPIIRYAEVLLIYAEAKLEQEGSLSDTDLNLAINPLRKRGGVAPLTNNLINDNGLDMLEEIRRERTAELYFEGFRLDDLKRWHIVKECMSEDICGFFIGSNSPWKKFSRGKDKDDNGFYRLCKKGDRVWYDYFDYSPIPYDQLRLSTGTLKQNEGYDDGGNGYFTNNL